MLVSQADEFATIGQRDGLSEVALADGFEELEEQRATEFEQLGKKQFSTT